MSKKNKMASLQAEMQNLQRMRKVHLIAAQDKHSDDPEVSEIFARLKKAELEMTTISEQMQVKRQECTSIQQELATALDKYIPEQYRM